MKYLIAMLCLISLPIASVHAEENFTTTYKCFTAGGSERWSASTTIARAPDKGDDRYTLIEKGAGILSGFTGKVSWEARLEFESTKDSVRPLSMESSIYNDAGKPIFTEREVFDHDAGRASYFGKDMRRKQEKKGEYSFKGDIANKLILGLYIQKFLENGQGPERSLSLLSSEPRLYKVTLRVIRKEEVVINGVKKEAFRLCLDPELGILDFVKIVVPKAYVWHSATPEYEWLKYRGLENSLGSPMVEITSGDVK